MTLLKSRILFTLICLFQFFAGSVLAEELITRFHSDISVAKDGEITVTETITVFAEGNRIKRGIYRDFPLMVELADGKEHKVGFEIVSVKRGGKDEPYHTERGNRSIRAYFGDKDVFLDRGEYTYEFTYRTDRQIRYFDDSDELFWNVTGNFWEFPIRNASATVTLPEGATGNKTIAYTGTFGSREQKATRQLSADGKTAEFAATRSLQAGEGLTIGVQMLKGSITPPSGGDEFWWFINDYRGEILALLGLFATGFYYVWAWRKVGVDPPKGVVVPRWDAPENISPALTNYIMEKGLDGKGWTAISAALINLAVKGKITLENLSGDLRIQASQGQTADGLPVGERALMTIINSNSGDLTISESNGSKVKRLQSKFASAMSGEHRSQFYNHNIGYIAGGIALSVLTVVMILIFGNLSENAIGLTIMVGVGCGVATIALINGALLFTRGRGIGGKIAAIVTMAFGGFFSMSAILPLAAAAFGFYEDFFLISMIIGLVITNVVFFFLMGAPTPLGREMMDGIEGLKQYLKLAEQDRMNLQGAPSMSPQHYEKLLPYAVALGLEKPWSNAFQVWLAAAVATGAMAATWGPNWYHGRRFEPDTFGKTMSDISTSIKDSLTESMPAPKSSSSGFSSGGGFSGGGGGGGGGGGW